jgi:site-specific DNA recombinase
VRYKDEIHDGEHLAIVDPGVFQQVQGMLRRNGNTGGAQVRNQFGALLKGLMRCAACNCVMSPSHTTRKNRRYRYYLCINAQKKGWVTCPSKSIPAQQIEAFVVDRIRCIGRDPELLRSVLAQAREKDETRTTELETEQRGLEKDLNRWHGEVRKLSIQLKPGEDNGELVGRLADLHERIGMVEQVGKVREQIKCVTDQLIPEEEATKALSTFDPIWETLTPNEQARVIELLVEKVEYDGRDGKVTVAFHPTGIKALAEELAEHAEEREIA